MHLIRNLIIISKKIILSVLVASLVGCGDEDSKPDYLGICKVALFNGVPSYSITERDQVRILANGLIVDRSKGYGALGHICTVGEQNTSVAMIKNITWSGDEVSYRIENYTNRNFATQELIKKMQPDEENDIQVTKSADELSSNVGDIRLNAVKMVETTKENDELGVMARKCANKKLGSISIASCKKLYKHSMYRFLFTEIKIKY